jgi:hypothetical protein
VCVGNADNPYWRLVARRFEGRTAQREKDNVDQRYKSSKRGVEDSVEKRWRVPRVDSARPRPLELAGFNLIYHIFL